MTGTRALVIAVFGCATIVPAASAPLLPDRDLRGDAARSDILQVAEGCGNGFHRSRTAQCVATARTRPDRYNRCPYGYHLGNPGFWCWANF